MDDLPDQARTAANEAALAAGLEVVDLHDHEDMIAVTGLLDAVWGREAAAGSLMVPEALTALAHAGNQISLARTAGRVVGATVAFLGRDEDGTTHLHSHITGVDAGATGRGVGRALKWHQRAWCLERGIGQVRWTFDGLVRRNAVFNLRTLGAKIVGFERDVYGRAPDERNAGLPTDRFRVCWQLDAPRVVAAAKGRTAGPDVAALRRTGAEVVLDEHGQPAPSQAPRRLVRIPDDVERLRRDDRDTAAAWATSFRTCVETALRDGLEVRGVTSDGWYLFAPRGEVAELTDDATRPDRAGS